MERHTEVETRANGTQVIRVWFTPDSVGNINHDIAPKFIHLSVDTYMGETAILDFMVEWLQAKYKLPLEAG